MIAMRDGNVAKQGSPHEILQTHVLPEIFEIDVPLHDIGGQRLVLFYLRCFSRWER
jgi:iron complex transport system ATP-binding protein